LKSTTYTDSIGVPERAKTPLCGNVSAIEAMARAFERLAAGVQRGRPNACWPWSGAPNSEGYGLVKIDGTNYRAHRLAYIAAYGEIDEGTVVRHRCHNRLCCNPVHLRAGTHADNVADRGVSGRTAIGSANGRAKLNEAQAAEIYLAAGTRTELGARYGVDPKVIRDIKLGRKWSHATGAAKETA
jgi:hypothetical protein